MEKCHVIFGYSTDDMINDVNITASQVTGRVNPNNVKKLVKKMHPRKNVSVVIRKAR